MMLLYFTGDIYFLTLHNYLFPTQLFYTLITANGETALILHLKSEVDYYKY